MGRICFVALGSVLENLIPRVEILLSLGTTQKVVYSKILSLGMGWERYNSISFIDQNQRIILFSNTHFGCFISDTKTVGGWFDNIIFGFTLSGWINIGFLPVLSRRFALCPCPPNGFASSPACVKAKDAWPETISSLGLSPRLSS